MTVMRMRGLPHYLGEMFDPNFISYTCIRCQRETQSLFLWWGGVCLQCLMAKMIEEEKAEQEAGVRGL
jgi:hypothetical protein